MSLVRFDPPGFLDDLNEQGKEIWHNYISGRFDEAREGDPGKTADGQEIECDFYGPREHYINPAKVELAEDAVEVDIEWTGFPRNITINSISDRQRWRTADSSRDKQDEYCEWSISRTSDGKIKQVAFTCETPEYWELLSKLDPDKLLEIYREHVNPEIRVEDIFHINGDYNPKNRWNSSTEDGAMHLIQINNTLGAEIELAGGASIRRVIDGRELTAERELIECGRYGGIERHSDPHIGAGSNSVARQLAYVSLANPVGIYFASLNTQGWVTPDGTDASEFWTYTRGTQEKPVRAIFSVPEEFGYAVGDIKISGKDINFGGQIADHIKMKLTAVGSDFGNANIAPMTGCVACRIKPTQVVSPTLESFTSQVQSMGGIRKHR